MPKEEPRSRRTRGELAADVLLLGALAASPLLAGVVHPETWLALAVVAAASWALAAGTPGARASSPPVLLIGPPLVLLLAALCQLIPLPPEVLASIAPSAAKAWSAGVPGGPAGSAWAPVHQAPSAGSFDALRLVALTAIAGAASARASSRRWRGDVVWVLVAAVGVAQVVALAHTVAAEPRLFGLWAPTVDPRPRLLAPVINENHWTALLSLASVVGIAAVASQRGPRRAVAAALAVVATAGVMAAHGSRIGVAGLAAGLSVLAVLHWSAHSAEPLPGLQRWARRLVPIGAGAVFLGGAAAVIVARTPTVLWYDTGAVVPGAGWLGKLELLPSMFASSAGAEWTGIGASAFVDVYAGVRATGVLELHHRAENVVVDLMVSYGWLAGAAALAGLTGLGARVLRGGLRHPARRGAAAALAGLAVHELADFSLHTGAVGGWALVLAASVLAPRGRWLGQRAQIGAALVLAAAAFGLAPQALERGTDRRTWAVEVRGVEAGEQSWDELAARVFAERPRSFPLAQDVARGYAREQRWGPALQWLNRAQQLAPRHTQPHLWTARVLADAGARRQALGEYGRALALDWRYQGPTIVREIAARFDEPDAFEVATTNLPGAGVPRTAWQLMLDREPRGLTLAGQAQRVAPDEPLTAVVGSRASLLSGRPAEAADIATRALARPGLSEWTEVRLLQTLYASGAQDEARHRLQRVLRRPGRHLASTWLESATWARQAGELPRARAALRQARAIGRGDELAAAHALLAQIALDENDPREALRHAREGLRHEPSSAGCHAAAAMALVAAGRHDEAAASAQRARAGAPGDAAFLAWAEREGLLTALP